MLEEMGHPQPPNPLITDSNTAHGLTTGAMIPKRSKAVDMRFHWLKCREAQQQFNIKWKQGTVNKADYPSKHHPLAVHQQRCSQYIVNAAVTPENEILAQQIKNVARCMRKVLRTKIHLQGCAKTLLGLTQTKS